MRSTSRRLMLGSTLAVGSGVLAAACGPLQEATPGSAPASGASKEKVTITYSSWGSPAQAESIDAEVAAWSRKHPQLNIEVQSVVQPWGGYHEKMQVLASGGSLPDVNIVSGAFYRNIALQNAFLDVRRYFERDRLTWDNLPPGVKNFLTLEGKLYGLPIGGLGVGGAMMNIHKGLFQKAGLPVPTLNWTWDDLLQHARKLTVPGGGESGGQWGVDFGKSTWEAVWGTMLRAYGGDVWNSTRTESSINSPAAKTVFQYLKDLVDRWNVSHPQGGDPSFYAGQVGMSVAWSGAASQRMQKAEFPVGVAATPRGPAGQGVAPPTGQSHTYSVAATTKHPEESWRFVKFLITEPEALQARQLNAVASVSWKPLVPLFAQKIPAELKEWWDVGQHYIKHTPAALSADAAMRLLPSYDDQMGIISTQLKRFYGGEIGIDECVNEMKRLLDARLREVQAAAPK